MQLAFKNLVLLANIFTSNLKVITMTLKGLRNQIKVVEYNKVNAFLLKVDEVNM